MDAKRSSFEEMTSKSGMTVLLILFVDEQLRALSMGSESDQADT